MRNLAVLVLLLLALVVVVVLRLTRGAGEAPPAIPEDDPALGVLTVGLPEGTGRAPENGAMEPGAPADRSPGKTKEEAGEAPGPETEPPPRPEGASPEPVPPGPVGEPAAEPGPPEPLREPRHVVQPGETLYSLVRRAYGIAPQALVEAVARANGLADAGRLRVGQELRFPVLEGYPEPREP